MTQTPLTISQLPDLGSVQGTDRLALDRIGAAVTAGSFVVGQAYQIISVGNTSFTTIGAESNAVGAYFVATGAGTGTGTAGPINTGDAPLSAVAALLGGDPAGTAAQAIATHVAAADPHPGYATPQEAAAAAPVQSVALSVPSGWGASSTNTAGSVTLTLELPSGFSLPSNAIQATWTAGATLASTAVQEGDIRLTDSREWSAATVSQATAEAGTSTTRAAYNPLRVFQSIAAWWAASAFKVKLEGIATGATANATDAQLRDRSTHTGTQTLSTITGLGTGVPTALAINIGTAGAPVILGGAGGTPSALGLVNATGLPLTTGVTGILPVANGGTGTATPGLIAGTHVSISGTWPNQTITVTHGGGGGGGGGDALTTNPLSQFAATTSAQLRGVISDETGTGLLFFQGGDVGTPSAGVLTNCTGLPIGTGVTGLGTGIATALAINAGLAGAPVLFNGSGGTPSSLVLTNATGLPFGAGISGKPTTMSGYGITDGFTEAQARATPLTGFTSGAGTVAATDSILQAFQKVVGNIAVRALTGLIGDSGLTMATNCLAGRSTAGVGAVEELTPIGLAISGTNLATLADLVIPLSDETTALTASSTVAKVTIPYWPRTTVITGPWIWATATAPTGAALQFDIQVGGASIYLPASGGTYPTIAAGATNSTASAGVFTTAFAAAPTIAAGSSVAFFVRQVGSTVAGAGLKVIAQTRRAG